MVKELQLSIAEDRILSVPWYSLKETSDIIGLPAVRLCKTYIVPIEGEQDGEVCLPIDDLGRQFLMANWSLDFL